jgi:hypothetical protein
MAAETTKETAAPAQSANGRAPVPDDPPCEDCATGSERLMGALGIAAAIGLLFIGVDLVTGGALSRALFPGKDEADAAG